MLLSCHLMLKRVFQLFPLLSRRGHLGGVNEAHGPFVRFDLKTRFCEIRVRTRIALLFKFLLRPSLREVGKFVCGWYQGSRPDLLWTSALTVAFMTLSEAVWARWQAGFTLVCYLAFTQRMHVSLAPSVWADLQVLLQGSHSQSSAGISKWDLWNRLCQCYLGQAESENLKVDPAICVIHKPSRRFLDS